MSFEPVKGLLHFLFPNCCAVCDKPVPSQDKWICYHCAMDLPETQWHKVKDNRLKRQFSGRLELELAVARWHYSQKSMVRRIVHQIKYRGREDIARDCGKGYGAQLMTLLAENGVDLLVPVPMHKSKMRQRGFNQAALIADGVSEITGIPVVNDALSRVASGGTQTARDRYSRWQQLQTLYQRGAQMPSGKHVLLIDDVITTGATLERCGRLIKQGENKLSVLALAAA